MRFCVCTACSKSYSAWYLLKLFRYFYSFSNSSINTSPEFYNSLTKSWTGCFNYNYFTSVTFAIFIVVFSVKFSFYKYLFKMSYIRFWSIGSNISIISYSARVVYSLLSLLAAIFCKSSNILYYLSYSSLKYSFN